MAITTNKFVAANSEILFLIQHTLFLFKFLRDSPVLVSSLPKLFRIVKIGHRLLIVMATISYNDQNFLFKLTLTRKMKLNDKKGRKFARNTFKHFTNNSAE